MVRLCSQNETLKSLDVLKAAKQLKDLNEYKNIAISPDLYVEQRLIQKNLINTRKELNKKLKELNPNSSYYYCIRNNKIVIKSKFKTVGEICKEEINKIVSNEINEFKKSQFGTQSSLSCLNMPLLNKVIEAKTQDIESKKLLRIAENISFQAIRSINDKSRWTELERVFDMSTSRLTKVEDLVEKLANKVQEIDIMGKKFEHFNLHEANGEHTLQKPQHKAEYKQNDKFEINSKYNNMHSSHKQNQSEYSNVQTMGDIISHNEIMTLKEELETMKDDLYGVLGGMMSLQKSSFEESTKRMSDIINNMGKSNGVITKIASCVDDNTTKINNLFNILENKKNGTVIFKHCKKYT